MIKKQFDLSKVILTKLIYDDEINNWMSNIFYNNDGNNLLMESPLMIIEKITYINTPNNPKIIIYASLSSENNQFVNTITEIEKHICNEVSNMISVQNIQISDFFEPINNKEIFKFLIPVYHNEINVVVTDASNNDVLSVKDLKLKSKFKAILYLSHLELEKKRFYLNWNIIQIKIE